MTLTLQCPICVWTVEAENPVDALKYHLLQFHTSWRIAEELAQHVYSKMVVADPGR